MTDDPQQLVDDALSPVTSSMDSLPPAAVAPEPPVVDSTPVMTPAPSISMGDETPLAFAAQPTVEPITPTSPPLPEPTYVPPAQDVPKPKKHGSKILMMVLGIFGLLGVLGVGGYYAYIEWVAPRQVIEIAEVKDKTQDSCNGCHNGGWLVWRDGKCKVTGICDSGKPGKDTKNPNPSPSPDSTLNTQAKCEADADGNPSTPGKKGAWCGKTPDGKCGGFCNTTPNRTCDQLLQEKCNYTPTRGSSCALEKSDTFFKDCDCDGTPVYFSTTGSCESKTGGVSDGLCEVYRKAGNKCGGTGSGGGTGGNSSLYYTCNANGCSVTDLGWSSGYKVYKHQCPANTGTGSDKGCQVASPAVGKSQSFSASCGTEQIDVDQSGSLVDFRSKTYPSACGKATSTPSPSGSPAPKLVCNSLTKNVADTALKLNSAIVFTCNAAVIPASAGTLTYQFRYMIGTGAWQTLAASGKTASLTPTQCGVQYQVQCRACATLGGVKKCDPVWQGVPVP